MRKGLIDYGIEKFLPISGDASGKVLVSTAETRYHHVLGAAVRPGPGGGHPHDLGVAGLAFGPR